MLILALVRGAGPWGKGDCGAQCEARSLATGAQKQTDPKPQVVSFKMETAAKMWQNISITVSQSYHFTALQTSSKIQPWKQQSMSYRTNAEMYLTRFFIVIVLTKNLWRTMALLKHVLCFNQTLYSHHIHFTCDHKLFTWHVCDLMWYITFKKKKWRSMTGYYALKLHVWIQDYMTSCE